MSGIWQALSSSPWLAVLFGTAVALAVVRFVRGLVHSGAKDPTRLFSREQKAVILDRAGGRCEYHGWVFGRCKASERLEADHVHPHSRGGWTDVANGQALCRKHNRMKLASVPYGWQLRSLERRRQSYFPLGVSGAVTRRAGRRPAADGASARGDR